VNLLLDEQLEASVANALNALTYRHGCLYSSIRNIAPGTKDPDIPPLCRDHGRTLW
jgi:hypothetical protein